MTRIEIVEVVYLFLMTTLLATMWMVVIVTSNKFESGDLMSSIARWARSYTRTRRSQAPARPLASSRDNQNRFKFYKAGVR
jgi:hypothetical protein